MSSTLTLNDFNYTVREFTLRVLGRRVIQSELTSAQSSGVNTFTAKAGISDFKIIEDHPLIPVYGRFRDDPTWDRFKQSMAEYSQQVDALERTPE